MFISQFDKKYMEWGKILTKTHSMTESGCKLFLSTVNLTLGDISTLESLHDNLIVENELVNPSDIPLVAKRVSRPNTRDQYGVVGNHMPEFMACRKAGVLQSVFKKFPNEKLFIITDADIFINRSYPFEEEISNCDALLLRGNNPNPEATGQGFHTQVRSGVIVLKNNQRCKELVDSWVDNMSSYDKIKRWKKWHWFWDQVTLKIAVEKLINNGMIVKNLPHEKFIDSSFNKGSYMWSAHLGGAEGKRNTLESWKKIINI